MSLSVIGAVAAAVIGSTGAFFSDSETSTGNTFTAGAIDLKVDSQQHYNNAKCVGGVWVLEDSTAGSTNPQYPVLGQPCGGTWGQNTPGVDITNEKFFEFGDVKPGDSGENTISLHVINNDAYVCATVASLTNANNSTTEPESTASGNTSGGDLQNAMLWKVWRDDGSGSGVAGDNIQNGTEPTLTSGHPVNGTLAVYDSTTATGALAGGTTGYLGVSWSLPLSTGNEVQTDSLTGDISFTVVQSRNNGSFKCSDGITTTVNQSGLETQSKTAALTNGKWFFYDDNADNVMTIDQFSGTSGQNHMELVAGFEGAKMVLGMETNPRYNIATYKYKNVKLSDISTLKYRVYDTTADSDKPYLHFNVDFFNTDAWQSRLVYVPTSLPVNIWTEVDALQGGAALWTYSGAFWPAGAVDMTGTTPGTTPRSWADVKANYPIAETRSTDSWLGVRVGEPGPASATGVVDWIQFNSEKTDFAI